eukprot:GHVU01086318.1.p1 GENE.GHVU01086318.1~~GHVU01086318.1.p1  ORF type:complete len:154 (-),score=13.20 GHVU01086318.1:252-713(-)
MSSFRHDTSNASAPHSLQVIEPVRAARLPFDSSLTHSFIHASLAFSQVALPRLSVDWKCGAISRAAPSSTIGSTSGSPPATPLRKAAQNGPFISLALANNEFHQQRLAPLRHLPSLHHLRRNWETVSTAPSAQLPQRCEPSVVSFDSRGSGLE